MAENVPVTLWRQSDGQGEMGQSSSANITTLSNLLITTLAGIELIILPGSFTATPVTEWVENDGA